MLAQYQPPAPLLKEDSMGTDDYKTIWLILAALAWALMLWQDRKLIKRGRYLLLDWVSWLVAGALGPIFWVVLALMISWSNISRKGISRPSLKRGD